MTTRWLTIALLLCITAPVFAQGKAKNKPKNDTPVAGEKEDASRVVLAFDPGSHTRPISALGFNKDQSRLITVGWDYSIQIWSTKTGERLDILRLPAYGRDNGFDSNRWNHAAISADGAFVAIGGGPKLLYDDKGIPTRLLVVDVVNRRVRKVNFPADPKSPVTCLAFSANGDRLVVGFGGTDKAVYVLDELTQLMRHAPDAKVPSSLALVIKGMKDDPHHLALTSTGNRLAIGEIDARITSWDVSGKAAEKWRKLGDVKHPGKCELIGWAPDESHFAWAWHRGDGSQHCGIELRSPEGKLLKDWKFGDLEPGFGRQTTPVTFRYLDADRLFITAHAALRDEDARVGCVGVLLNPKTGITVRLFTEESNDQYTPVGDASKTGTLGAITAQHGLEAVVYTLADGKVVARCGSQTPVPSVVGWSKAAKSPAVAWSDDAELKPFNAKREHLKYAFDLVKVEPVAKVEPSEFSFRLLDVGNWKLTSQGRNVFRQIRLKENDTEVTKFANSKAVTLIPNGKDRPLVAQAFHDELNNIGSSVSIFDGAGKKVVDLLSFATQHSDMVSSPDGRYLLVSTGTHRLSIYRTDGSRFPFLNLVQASGEWVSWTPEGYYAASPGGEKLIGWAESRGSNEFSVFHPAEKFVKEFRRPDVLQLALEKGSLSLALEALKTETRAVENILPPKCELKLVKQTGGRIQVQAIATPSAKDKPVVALRMLLDGRPLAGGIGQKNIKTGEKAEATWDLDIPLGNHELKLLARGEESSAVSESLVVKGPKSAGQQPVLHRLCIGVDKYALPALDLGSAAKDATDVYAALEKYCVGAENRFGSSRGALLTDKQATRSAVLKAIADTRKSAKPGDLVVLLFAGHGVKQQDEYYLLTHEADPSQSLKGKSLSGADLRQALGDMECPVLLVMDSCHSAGGVKSFRPATDDLTRGLTDDSAGVTVLAAAMAHEVASATAENGHFTAAFLKALQLGQGVPYDPHDHLLYTHHIYSVVFSEVRKATGGKQNPFLNMPWTVPPLALREVPGE